MNTKQQPLKGDICISMRILFHKKDDMVNNISGVPSEYRQRLKFISLNTKKSLVEVQKDFIFFVKQHRSHDKMRFSKSLTKLRQKYMQ